MTEHFLKCLIRGEEVSATPEEVIRQGWLRLMIEQLNYPSSHIILEKELSQMPHLRNLSQKIPQRRLDIICYSSNIHSDYSLYPLLIVECKSIALTPKVLNQVIGYNRYIKAFFLAVVNKIEVQTCWYDPQKKAYTTIPSLPSYLTLLNSIRNKTPNFLF